MITIYHCLALSGILFAIGVVGVMTRRNMIIMMMSVELMLNSVTLNLIVFSRYHNNMYGQILSLMIMTVAAAETAIGLAILIAIFRKKSSVNADEWNLMKW